MGQDQRTKKKRRSKSCSDEEKALTAVPEESDTDLDSDSQCDSESDSDVAPAPARCAPRRRQDRTVGFCGVRCRRCRCCRGCGWVRDTIEITVALVFIYWLATDWMRKHGLLSEEVLSDSTA